MSTRFHYDEKGRYRGRSLSDSDLALELVGLLIFVPAALFLALRWIWHGMLGYAKLALPYKWLVGYYYFTMGVPYMWADKASRWAMKSTPWPNLNFVLACLVFFAVLLFPYATVIALARRTASGWRILRAVAVGPLMVMVLWWAGATALEWLIAK